MKQLCVSKECISINDNVEVVDIGFYIKCNEGERELNTGETQRERESKHLASVQSSERSL